MTTHTRFGLSEKDRLDGSSNIFFLKVCILFFLDEFGQKEFTEKGVGEPSDLDELRLFKKHMSKAKWMILDGIRDHFIPHVALKNIA